MKFPWIVVLLWGPMGFTDSTRLLIANRKDIRMLDVDRNSSKALVDKQTEAAALSFLYATGTLFWSDAERRRILSADAISPARNTNPSSRVLVSNNIGQVDGLACDWVTMKIYWTDNGLKRIEVAQINGTNRKVLFWDALDCPRSIALVPQQGIMFWTDWGESAKIERATMDGDPTYRKVILSTPDLVWPNGITVDFEDNRVFYSDAKDSRIYSMRFDGSDRKLIQKYEGHPYSITVNGIWIYWTDWHFSTIYSSFKQGGSMKKTALKDWHLTPLDIKAYSQTTQLSNISSPCSTNNGGCSHLCLLTSTLAGYSCGCPTGVQMLPNGKTCEKGVKNMLFVARKLDLKAISLDTHDHTPLGVPLVGVKHVVSVDYDPIDGFVYWADDQTRQISRARLNGSSQESIISRDLYLPDGLAVDWIARNIYFVDVETRRIQVARLSGKFRKTIISEGLETPRAVAVDSNDGRMYWTDWGRGRIERSALDGSMREPLVDTDIAWPNGLALDVDGGKMYWGDAKYHRIEVASLDGRGRNVLLEQVPHAFGLTLFRGFLYWTEWKLVLLERYNLADKKREVVASNLADMMMISARSVQNVEESGLLKKARGQACFGGGGCSHLCLNTPKGSLCACPDTMRLSDDATTCVQEKATLLIATLNGMLLQSGVDESGGLHKTTKTHISQVEAVGSLDYHYQSQSLYFVDQIQKTIFRTFLNNSGRVEAVVKYGIEKADGLAVDWLTGNLYWSDSVLDRIEMSRLNGAYRKVLLWKDIEPSAMIVDPLGKQLYWADNFSSPPRIERCRLDGSKRSKLVETKALATALTFDPVDKKIYWSDGDSVESIEPNGKSRRFITTSPLRISNLAVYGGVVFLGDEQNVIGGRIADADKAAKVWSTDGLSSTTKGIVDLKILHRVSQLGWNHCAIGNGGCSALCLAAPHKDKGFYCACATHYTLEGQAENATCLLPHNLLLFAQKSSINRVMLGIESADIVLPISAARNIRVVQYDPYTGYIFWLDFKANNILKAKDDGSDVGVALSSGTSNNSRIADFALDPITGQLFWICSVRQTINVARLMPEGDFKPLGVIATAEAHWPKHIAAHPHKSLIVFTSVSSSGFRLQRCAFDGSNLKILYHSREQARDSSALVIDTGDDLVFWSDSTLKKIESIALDGDNPMTVTQGIDATSLAVHEIYIVALSRSDQAIYLIEKITGKRVQAVISRRSHLTAIFTLAANLPLTKPRECSCSHICMIHGQKELKFACSCPTNFSEGSCDVASSCSSSEHTCKSGGVRCLPMEMKCNGREECSDGSDEVGCCQPQDRDTFKCRSNALECISSNKVCDGHPDCTDGSDEKDCEPSGDCDELSQCCHGGFKCPKAGNRNVCISSDKICNEVNDCLDRTEEISCCGIGQFQCHESPDCIDVARVCDGIVQCADGSDEFSCCSSDTCSPGGSLQGHNELLSTSDTGGIQWPVYLVGVLVIVIIVALLLYAKRDAKTVEGNTMRYQVRSAQVVSAPPGSHLLLNSSGPASIPSSLSTSDKKSCYPYNPPPSPATVQSYEYFYPKNHLTRSGASSTCSSSQFYVASDASFLAGQAMARHQRFVPSLHRTLQRPNTPCSTDMCDDFYAGDYNIEGYCPPPATPIPTEKSFLCDHPPTHDRFI